MSAVATRMAAFVVHEARLIDEGRYDEWLALFADDGRYWVPLRVPPRTKTRRTTRSPTKTACCSRCAWSG